MRAMGFGLRASAIVVLFLALPLDAAPRPADDVRDVERLERDLVAAIARSDLATYGRIVADDYVAFEASGKESTRAQIIESYRSGERHYSGLEIFDVHGRVFGDTAVVSARTRGYRREGDHEVPNQVRYIRVYARREGQWRAVTQMAAPLTEPRP